MNDLLTKAVTGLRYISETDHPFEVFELEGGSSAEDALREQFGIEKTEALKKESLTYFFRNMVKSYPNDPPREKERAFRFQQLQETLQSNLENIEIYRFGQTQIQAFIVGKGKDGKRYGLRTVVVET